MGLQLSEEELEAVNRVMANSAAEPHLTGPEMVRAWVQSDWSEGVSGLARRYPSWSAEELKSICRFDNPYFSLLPALERAISRRVKFDSSAEIGTLLALTTRFQWAQLGHSRAIPTVQRERYFLSILQGIAANDFVVADRFATAALSWAEWKPDVKEYAVATGAVAALVRQDEAELRVAIERMDRCRPKAYLAAIFETLRGAANRSPDQVAAGLNGVLKQYPKYMMGDAVLKLFDPWAHGLFLLCRRRGAELTAKFDHRRSWPWDEGYLAWWDSGPKPLAGVDLSTVDAESHRVLIELHPPLWWAAPEEAAW